MIIPIRCMNCGKPIADKWLYFQQELKEYRTSKKIVGETPYYMDATTVPDTPEKRLLDYLGLHRSCCRKHFLTQKDLMDKI
jgi:DNA-directed RNA polymerase subunit N (RpoN/RPB10)